SSASTMVRVQLDRTDGRGSSGERRGGSEWAAGVCPSPRNECTCPEYQLRRKAAWNPSLFPGPRALRIRHDSRTERLALASARDGPYWVDGCPAGTSAAVVGSAG